MNHQPSYYLTLNLPKGFSREDAEKIQKDVLDFIEGKRHYGAKYDGKAGITVNVITVSTNHD
jgi:hypothetical protein